MCHTKFESSGLRRNLPVCRWGVVLLVLAATAGGLQGAEQAATASKTTASPKSTATTSSTAWVLVGQPAKISLEPATFVLIGRDSRQPFVVTGFYADDELRDLTLAARVTSSNSAVVVIENGQAKPVGNGVARITATIGSTTATAKVMVKEADRFIPVSFKNQTLPALTKASCNAGSCHGSPSGKNGFRLSLRAFKPSLDAMTLRTEFSGRRVNVMAPEESLILRKPLMTVAHGGGQRLHKGGAVYTVLRDWIAQGLRVEEPRVPDLVRIEVLPRKRVFLEAGRRQRLYVNGFFSDGSVRDLTSLTIFSSSNESVATVSDDGLVKKTGRGETAVLARFLDKMSTSHITFLNNVPGFVWNNPPENNFVDKLVMAKLQQLQILPSQLCSDEEFIRRAYLDTTGRLPYLSETAAFLADKRSDKRNRLIDRLLDSDDYAKFWTLKWCDILRSNSSKIKQAGVSKLHHWVYKNIRGDKPLDQFTRDLLTSGGSVYENPAANYWRASRDPQDATETTAQLFLGIRIQCAKCHNHPFERWTQDNYYGIAAAFVRVGRKKGARKDDEIIFVASSGESLQPETGKTMKVHLLLKGDVDVPPNVDRRVVFAKWLTTAENPFFARSLVNRIWGHLMGRGIVEPVDDFRDSNPPSNEELLNELAQKFAAHHFSQKWTIRTIMRSRVYQLSSRKNEFNATDEIYNSHATARLLSAEQLLDAICQVTEVPESYSGGPSGMRAVELSEPPLNNPFMKVFGQPQREMACQCERSNESNLSQALQMINGPVVNSKVRSAQSRIARMIKAHRSDEEIVNALYLAALCRKPAALELATSKKHLAISKNREQALEDIGWALLNSKEFLFQH